MSLQGLLFADEVSLVEHSLQLLSVKAFLMDTVKVGLKIPLHEPRDSRKAVSFFSGRNWLKQLKSLGF